MLSGNGRPVQRGAGGTPGTRLTSHPELATRPLSVACHLEQGVTTEPPSGTRRLTEREHGARAHAVLACPLAAPMPAAASPDAPHELGLVYREGGVILFATAPLYQRHIVYCEPLLLKWPESSYSSF